MTRWSRRIPGADVVLDLEADFDRVVKELGASRDDVRKATSRALRRTATTLRVMSSKRIVPELELRRAGDFRRRLKSMKARIKADGGTFGLWVGLNDMGVSKFKGRVSEYSGGAAFRSHELPGAFVAKGRDGRRSIFRRKGSARFPLVEEKLPIKDRVLRHPQKGDGREGCGRRGLRATHPHCAGRDGSLERQRAGSEHHLRDRAAAGAE
ncbi:phage tail protein [Paracoccus yeei]|uniref:phage tail protein n=1 Tax=Paracoccus yeei TaxID=147645 RepID=UPI0028D0A986|nr:phage tail protein [Paracoccus yeei]